MFIISIIIHLNFGALMTRARVIKVSLVRLETIACVSLWCVKLLGMLMNVYYNLMYEEGFLLFVMWCCDFQISAYQIIYLKWKLE